MPKKNIRPLPPPAPLPSAEPLFNASSSVPDQQSPKQRSQSPNAAKEPGHRVHIEWVNIAILISVVLFIVAAIFYALNGQPLFPIELRQSLIAPQPIGAETPVRKIPEPAFIVLGELNGEIFTFNKGVKTIFAFNPTLGTDRSVLPFDEFDSFWWHEGKLTVISHARNTLGNIYTVTLTQTNPAPTLVTDRDSGTFPRSLSVESSLPLALTTSGDAIAFVAKDLQNNTESLFLFEVNSKRLIYTPARNLQRISSILWIGGDKQLALVAISDGQEIRYIVDRQGGNFGVWNTK